RFYAFVRDRKSGRFVCEVNYHYTREYDWWDMGVLVYAPYRGCGFGKRALELLLHQAFVVDGITRLHNDFEDTRTAALAIHHRAGFREVGESRILRFGESVRVLDLVLTREEYFNSHPEYRI
ncbi:MAG: GNAT family N-acetyltransferase, partial [Oscillospiraceae bacterium]|nr:GNAT family N-acetyltransferase [Oscillospiraceae bacterium]